MEYRSFENRVIAEVGARAKPTYDNSEYHKRLAKIINEPYFMRAETLGCEIRSRGYNPNRDEKSGRFTAGTNVEFLNETSVDIDLTEDERRSIITYISSKSYIINENLRLGNELDDIDKETVKHLDSALKKRPKYEGDVTRSVTLHSESQKKQFLEEHKKGKVVSYQAFTSVTRGNTYDPKANVQISIKNSKNARDLTKYNSAEQELLYGRNTEFKVLNVSFNDGVHYMEFEEF